MKYKMMKQKRIVKTVKEYTQEQNKKPILTTIVEKIEEYLSRYGEYAVNSFEE